MSDAEALGAAVTIWLAVVLLSLAGDYASSVRVVNRSSVAGPLRFDSGSPTLHEQSRVAPGREAEEHAYHGTIVPGAIPPRETVGGAQGRNTIQSVGIANNGPGDTSPAPGPLGVGSGRAALGPMSIGHPAESSATETAVRPLATARTK